MNKPTLTVRNFGPLQSVDLVVDDVITLIGPQASGKSTLCKAIFLFRTIRELFERAVSERFYQSNGQLHSGQLTAFIKQRFRDTFGDTPAQGHWALQYDYGNQVKCRFEADGENGNFRLHLDERIHTALAEWVRRAAEVRNELANRAVQGLPTPAQVDDERTLTNQFFEALRLAASILFNDNADLHFIPAGRSLFTALPASVLAASTPRPRRRDTTTWPLRCRLPRRSRARPHPRACSPAITAAATASPNWAHGGSAGAGA